jgi:hypothetical protein
MVTDICKATDLVANANPRCQQATAKCRYGIQQK